MLPQTEDNDMPTERVQDQTPSPAVPDMGFILVGQILDHLLEAPFMM